MGKIKLKRSTPSIDMTPMVDLAFLLVTFFMLTTKFAPSDPLNISIPASISEIKIPATHLMTISMGGEGRVFFDLTGRDSRKRLLNGMAGKYGIQFTPTQIEKFTKINAIGIPIQKLSGFLDLKPEQRKELEQPGVPVDSLNNQLKDWILMARMADPKARITIKGDMDVPYPIVKKVIGSIQASNVNRFNFITSLKKVKK